MKRKIVILLIFIMVSYGSFGQINLKRMADSLLVEGMYLYTLENAAWIASDMVLKKGTNANLFNGYLSYFKEDSVITIFYYYDTFDTDIIYTVSFKKDKIEFNDKFNNNTRRKPNLREVDLIKRRERIKEAIKESPLLSSYTSIINFNIAINDQDSIFKCYLMAGIEKDSIIPTGADFCIYVNSKCEITDIKQFHSRFLGEKVRLKIDSSKVTSTAHTHLTNYSEFIVPTEICVYKLYDKRSGNCTKHEIIGEHYVSLYDSSIDSLNIVVKEEFMRSIGNKKVKKISNGKK